jgi:hypothetical protein
MQFIKNPEKEIILKSIEKYGYFPEHNINHYFDLKEEGAEPVLVLFGNGMSLLTYHYEESNYWWVVPEPLAPNEKQLEIMMQFLNQVFDQGAEKVQFELNETLRLNLVKEINKQKKFRAIRPAYSLFWPIFHMKNWDHTLSGKKWKIIRNLQNFFLREYEPEIVTDINNISKEELNNLVKRWMKNRRATDRIDDEQYYNIIKGGFEGCDSVRVFTINGTPVSITAGWRIPNSNNYYSAIGILDYEYKGIGEAANIDDLTDLKKKGYEFVDFGGSCDGLFDFKLKFQPHYFYRTDFFSVVKQKE